VRCLRVNRGPDDAGLDSCFNKLRVGTGQTRPPPRSWRLLPRRRATGIPTHLLLLPNTTGGQSTGTCQQRFAAPAACTAVAAAGHHDGLDANCGTPHHTPHTLRTAFIRTLRRLHTPHLPLADMSTILPPFSPSIHTLAPSPYRLFLIQRAAAAQPRLLPSTGRQPAAAGVSLPALCFTAGQAFWQEGQGLAPLHPTPRCTASWGILSSEHSLMAAHGTAWACTHSWPFHYPASLHTAAGTPHTPHPTPHAAPPQPPPHPTHCPAP